MAQEARIGAFAGEKIAILIGEVFDQSKGSYGSPRVTKALNMAGIAISRPRVARLMRKAHLRSRLTRKFVNPCTARVTVVAAYKMALSNRSLCKGLKTNRAAS